MAEFTVFDLQRVWKAHGFTNWQIADVCGVSEDTVKGWLRTDPLRRSIPHPDDVGNIEHACHAEPDMIWHRWMMSNCESYRERHQEARPNALLGAIMAVRHELADVLNMQDAIERDAVDGTLDNPVLKAEYRQELEQAQSSITALLARIK